MLSGPLHLHGRRGKADVRSDVSDVRRWPNGQRLEATIRTPVPAQGQVGLRIGSGHPWEVRNRCRDQGRPNGRLGKRRPRVPRRTEVRHRGVGRAWSGRSHWRAEEGPRVGLCVIPGRNAMSGRTFGADWFPGIGVAGRDHGAEGWPTAAARVGSGRARAFRRIPAYLVALAPGELAARYRGGCMNSPGASANQDARREPPSGCSVVRKLSGPGVSRELVAMLRLGTTATDHDIHVTAAIVELGQASEAKRLLG